MAQKKSSPATVTIYMPQNHRNKDVLERLEKPAEKRNRSVTLLAVQAIIDVLEREEKRRRSSSRETFLPSVCRVCMREPMIGRCSGRTVESVVLQEVF